MPGPAEFAVDHAAARFAEHGLEHLGKEPARVPPSALAHLILQLDLQLKKVRDLLRPR